MKITLLMHRKDKRMCCCCLGDCKVTKFLLYLVTADIYIEKEQGGSGDGDFPGGPVVKSLSSSAGDAGLSPHQGTKIPHVIEQLSLPAATTEPMPQQRKIPHDARKDPHATTKTQSSQINRNSKGKKKKRLRQGSVLQSRWSE